MIKMDENRLDEIKNKWHRSLKEVESEHIID